MPRRPPEPNHHFRAARERLPSPNDPDHTLTRQELADAVNRWLADKPDPDGPVTANHVGMIEQGRTTWPRAWRRHAYRAILGATTDTELGFTNRRRRPLATEISPMRRAAGSADAAAQTALGRPGRRGIRETRVAPLMRAVSPLRTAIEPSGGFPTAPVGDSADRSSPEVLWSVAPLAGRDTASELGSFIAVTHLLASQRQVIAPGALLSLVEAHRDTLSALFRRAASDPVRADIGAVLGETSIVASRLWSALGNRAMALAHCAFARQLSDHLDNPTLAAMARIFESNLQSEAATLIGPDGDIVVGLRMLDEADCLGPRLPQAAKARIAAERAQAFAALGLERDARTALDRARDAADRLDDADRTGLFSDWTPSRIEVYEGTCELLLGNHDAAIDLLTTATSKLGTEPENVNVTLAATVDLSSALVDSGELERGCTLLAGTYRQLVKLGNRRGIARATRARQRLSRWRHEPAVRDLDVSMTDALAVATPA